MAERQSRRSNRQAEAKTPRIERITPEDLPEIYVNTVGLQSAIWDFKLDFGLVEQLEDRTVRVRDVIRVRMSPQHAKAFAKVLQQHVDSYEKRFGAIPQPADDLQSRVLRPVPDVDQA